ncbi:MAG: DUF4276 family protein [Phototrophicaceae bacterium]
MNTLYCLVEGAGDADAFPLLVRRILHEQFSRYELQVKAWSTNGRDNLFKDIHRYLELLRRAPDCAGVIIATDLEKATDCPVEIAYILSEQAKILRLPFPVAVVIVVCEYESWFLYNLSAIAERYPSLTATTYTGDPALKCNAKEWIEDHLPKGTKYRETEHQVSMTAKIDLKHTAEQSRSFRRMIRAVEFLVQQIDTGALTVSPSPP